MQPKPVKHLYQIIYHSVATSQLSDDQLRDLLVAARYFNHQARLTGLLLYANNRFLQVLEGEQAIVESLYQRIRHDTRHTQVETLLAGPLLIREFPDWSMGFAVPSTAEMHQFTGYVDSTRPDFLLPRAHNLSADLLDRLQHFIVERRPLDLGTNGVWSQL